MLSGTVARRSKIVDQHLGVIGLISKHRAPGWTLSQLLAVPAYPQSLPGRRAGVSHQRHAEQMDKHSQTGQRSGHTAARKRLRLGGTTAAAHDELRIESKRV